MNETRVWALLRQELQAVPFREPSSIIPEYLWEPKWHQKLRCRVFGHSMWELFARRTFVESEAELKCPAYCTCCGKTDPRGFSSEEFWEALKGWKRWLDNHA